MSLSRHFAAFVANLRYDDLPPAVADRAKGVTLQALSSALVAHDMPASRQALALMQDEEQGGAGIATVLCSGAKLTKAGAAFVNAEMILAGGKWDTFRMLTHPGTAIIPAALVGGRTRRRFRATVPHRGRAAYEVMERMAAEFIPTVMSRGFHAGPVFGIFAAAIAAAKLGGLRRRADPQRDSPVRQSGGRKPGRCAQRWALTPRGRRCTQCLARCRHGGARHAGWRDDARGRGGILSCLCREQSGAPQLQFYRPYQHRITDITQGLGKDWMFLETLYRIYSTAGYNIAHVDVTARLCEEHDISYERHRSHRSGRELVRNTISEPRFPHAGQRRQAACRQHRLSSPPMARPRGVSAAPRRAPRAGARSIRPKCSTSCIA